MTTVSYETRQLIMDYRKRIAAGEEIPPEDLAAALDMWRPNREKAMKAGAKKAPRPSKIGPNLNDLFKPKEEEEPK